MASASPIRVATAAGTTVALSVAGSLAGVMPAEASTLGPDGIPACSDLLGIYNSTPDLTTLLDFSHDYVLPCVPQYGIGKVEFTLNSDHDLPPDFALESALPTEITNDFDVADLIPYLGVDETEAQSVFPGAFQSLTRVDDGSNPMSATYQGILVLPLESATVTPLDQLPTECTGTYTHAFTVTAASRTTTFTGQSGLTAWTIPVAVSPAPITFALNMDPTGTSTNGDACISLLGQTQPITGVTDPLLYKAGTMVLLGLGVFAAAGLTEDLPIDFTIDVTPVETTIEVNESPALPNTGLSLSDQWRTGFVALALGALGGALVFLRRRRASRNS